MTNRRISEVSVPVELTKIAELIAKHLPPSVDRVCVHPLDETAHAWARALIENEFAVVCDDGECDAALASDLAQVPQVRLRPGGRAIFLLPDETCSLAELAAALQQAGFTRILTETVLEGAFLLVRGEPPSHVADRVAQVSTPGMERVVAWPDQPLPRRVFLLVHQEPPLRGWAQPDPASITWDAVTLRDEASAQSVLLGFSSLVKAVAFMKPAVLAGAIPDVNKMPRYRGETIAEWGMPVLIDPAFEALREDTRYTFGSPPVRIDPRLEDKLRE